MSEWRVPPNGSHMDRPSGIYYQTMTARQIENRLEQNNLIITPARGAA